MRRLAFLFFAVTPFLGAALALACSCGCDTDRLLETTPVFFAGKPLAMKEAGGRLRYEIEVVSVIKGTLPKRVVVTSPAGGGACRVSYDLGKS